MHPSIVGENNVAREINGGIGDDKLASVNHCSAGVGIGSSKGQVIGRGDGGGAIGIGRDLGRGVEDEAT